MDTFFESENVRNDVEQFFRSRLAHQTQIRLQPSMLYFRIKTPVCSFAIFWSKCCQIAAQVQTV